MFLDMKIVCLIDSLGPGGAQRQLVGLAVLLKQRGYDVSVVIYYKDLYFEDILISEGITCEYIETGGRKLSRIGAFAKYVRKSEPDVVIAYLETPSIIACLAHLFNKKFKLIVSERNTTQETGWKERLRFKLFEQADYVVPNAFSQGDYIKKRFVKLAARTVTIPNFVDLDYFEPKPHPREETPEIVVAASIWQSKNALGLLDAVKILADKGLQFHVSWYGISSKWLDYLDACNKKISILKIDKYIDLLEKTKDIRDKYQTSDFFCLPSFYEGTPNVICEAMACGVPIACSRVCDNGLYVHEGENGVLFDPLSPEDMAAKIERMLLCSDEEYTRYCANSRKTAELMFSKSSFADRYQKLIESE